MDERCGVDGQMVFLAYLACRLDVVGVVVGDEQGLDVAELHAVLGEVFLKTTDTDAAIDDYGVGSCG